MKILISVVVCVLAINVFGQSSSQKQHAVIRVKALDHLQNDPIVSKQQLNNGVYPLKYSLLEKVLAGFRFYTTTVNTNLYKYPLLEIAVAENIRTEEMIVTKSPIFTETDNRFLQVFEGIELEGDSLKSALAEEIGDLFARIMYQGKAKGLQNSEPNIVSIELWHLDLSWRFLDFVYEGNKRKQISITKGVGRSQILPSQYKRKT